MPKQVLGPVMLCTRWDFRKITYSDGCGLLGWNKKKFEGEKFEKGSGQINRRLWTGVETQGENTGKWVYLRVYEGKVFWVW